MKDPQNRNSPSFSERVQPALFLLFAFLLPTQLGRHFFLPFSYVAGIRIDYLSPTIYLTDILALVIIILNIKPVLAFFRNKKTALFLIILAATGFFSQVAPLFLYRFLKVTEVLALFSIFRHRFPQYRKQIILGFAGGAVLEAGLGLAQLLTQRSLQGVFYYLGERYMTLSTPGIAKASLAGTELLRPYGTFSHPNSLAGFFLLVYILFLTGAFITNRFLKYSVIFMASMLVFFSFSKNAILAYLLVTLLFAVREKTGCRICTLARTLSPVLLAGVFLFAQTDPASFEKRTTLLKESLILIMKYPLAGTGLGSYLVASQHFASKYPYFFLQPVHNVFLLFAAETGIPVFSVTLLFLVSWIKKQVRSAPFLLALLAVCMTGMFDHYWLTLQQNMLLLPVIFGIMNAYGRTKKGTLP
jgi:hypothetical protein